MTNLIPVVTATCPRRLNQPVTHDANGAFRGFEIIAAQKYGPPLVGCALQISELARYKHDAFWDAWRRRTCHSQAHQHREEGFLTPVNTGLGGDKKMTLPTTIQPQIITAGPPVVFEPSKKRTPAHPLPVRGAHQTEEKQRGDTGDDADDRERDSKVLSSALLQRL